MDEEQKQNNEQTPIESNEGDNTSTTGLVERADNISKRLEENIKAFDERIERYSNLIAREKINGRADAGQIQKTKEQAEKELIEQEVKKAISMFK